MRIDARRGDGPYEVYDAERMVFITLRVVWADDTLNAWGEYHWPPKADGAHLLVVARLAKRIVILPGRQLVVVNPVRDDVLWQALEALGEIASGVAGNDSAGIAHG